MDPWKEQCRSATWDRQCTRSLRGVSLPHSRRPPRCSRRQREFFRRKYPWGCCLHWEQRWTSWWHSDRDCRGWGPKVLQRVDWSLETLACGKIAGDLQEKARTRAPSTNLLVWQLQVTCEKGAEEGTQHESALLTFAGSNQRTKAKRKEHLPCHTAPANILTTSVHKRKWKIDGNMVQHDTMQLQHLFSTS